MITAGFLANGAKVYITARKAPALIEKAKELSDLYEECIPFPCDLSSSEGIDSFSNMIAENEDGIDYLINNAGAAWGEPFESFSEAGWDKVMDLNVKVFFSYTKNETMLTKRATLEDPSRVINIGSIDGLNVPGFPTFSYSTSKGSSSSFNKTSSLNLFRKYYCKCNSTRSLSKCMLGSAVNSDYSVIEKNNPRKRTGSPEDIAV